MRPVPSRSPYADVTVESWLYRQEDHHIRIHRINTPRGLETIEGGFAIACDEAPEIMETRGRAIAVTAKLTAAVTDLGSTVPRAGRCRIAMTNTNLVAPKTLVPQLVGKITAGTSLLRIAVAAGRTAASAVARSEQDIAAIVTSLERPFWGQREGDSVAKEHGRTHTCAETPIAGPLHLST